MGRGGRARAGRRGEQLQKAVVVVGAALLVLVVVFRSFWPYLVGSLVAVGLGFLGWRVWRAGRRRRGADREWRQAERVRAGHRTLTGVDAMSGAEFEELVAQLCRRDGCRDVLRVGRPGDDGVDVTGRLPDGRTMVIQCKRYAASSAVSSREVRDLLGAKVAFGADLAVFVTTTRFSGPSEKFAREQGILALHRDHLGLWHNGTRLDALLSVNGAGQGDARHRARWRRTYGHRTYGRRTNGRRDGRGRGTGTGTGVGGAETDGRRTPGE